MTAWNHEETILSSKDLATCKLVSSRGYIMGFESGIYTHPVNVSASTLTHLSNTPSAIKIVNLYELHDDGRCTGSRDSQGKKARQVVTVVTSEKEFAKDTKAGFFYAGRTNLKGAYKKRRPSGHVFENIRAGMRKFCKILEAQDGTVSRKPLRNE
ncbi:hypothetical protein PAXINDRAFT_103906 [Paxillus involutus ATCC 200175]|uniref:Uncharacterized protein n=1 Tax=Paxillus involutus ATCC 200175 TaxID=664439 RepID=A0A0C9ST35_PAXIN|nr:hypothetical protein PAXINDRAFT_103906 [Paxillus involutus ATCC 200175]